MKNSTLHTFALCALLATGPLAIAGEGHGDHDHATSTIGIAGDAAKATRTVNIDMNDTMRFTPANVQASQGETIRFVVKNSGKVKHELVLGTKAALKEHYEMMMKFPEMEHASPNMITLAPGQSGEVVWQFTRSGQVDFACLQPGHYDAGMKGAVKVMVKKMPVHESKKMDEATHH
ncbi:cupredoxin family protein [Herbaspirillum sp. RTI4]|uniref:cupredoxin domain-containing protein n=1 Tax=Herbaspirillum sp. RTI4 TaxID=3048640 RepID=UPI002AB4BB89|nr:cupredoxin family protein [Herbaspirillum sp. RTI4]MDY7579073.1 cupredoxin family protein [Herbaspirillum sp. RTI4]MEA9982343.1 cupredoxin family protein [Herbaspirillum sp. RTI4]